MSLLYMTRRATLSDPWEIPVNLGQAINSSDHEESPSVSFDGITLLYDNYSSHDIWQSPIIPIIDFNGDGIVDSADMCILIDHWGENYSLCDIAPMPWGDGIVDVQDLIVLAEHVFEYRRPIAHWTLDERQGSTAYDKVGENNASVYAGALWQPAGGMFGGALEFDGIDDYFDTDFVLDPMEDSFSVFEWIKGGAPG